MHYHVEGEGTPLVLQHGLTSSILRWYSFGFVDALKNDYRLLIIDARGHGDSDKLYDTESYDRKAMASDVVAVLDAENIDKAHYMGYSMGGSIGFGIAESLCRPIPLPHHRRNAPISTGCHRARLQGGAHQVRWNGGIRC